MLKVHFIKNFSIKKCVLDKSLLDPLEFQSHLPEAWSASLQPGTAGSAGPGGGSPGRAAEKVLQAERDLGLQSCR